MATNDKVGRRNGNSKNHIVLHHLLVLFGNQLDADIIRTVATTCNYDCKYYLVVFKEICKT